MADRFGGKPVQTMTLVVMVLGMLAAPVAAIGGGVNGQVSSCTLRQPLIYIRCVNCIVLSPVLECAIQTCNSDLRTLML